MRRISGIQGGSEDKYPGHSHHCTENKQFTEVLVGVLSEEMAVDGGRSILEGLESLKEETNFVYEELINISAIARDENLVQVSPSGMKWFVILFTQEMFKSRRSIGGEEQLEELRQVSEEKSKILTLERMKLSTGQCPANVLK